MAAIARAMIYPELWLETLSQGGLQGCSLIGRCTLIGRQGYGAFKLHSMYNNHASLRAMRHDSSREGYLRSLALTMLNYLDLKEFR